MGKIKNFWMLNEVLQQGLNGKNGYTYNKYYRNMHVKLNFVVWVSSFVCVVWLIRIGSIY